jgi:hypothetical protein
LTFSQIKHQERVTFLHIKFDCIRMILTYRAVYNG